MRKKYISAVLSCYSNFLFVFFLSVTRPKPSLGQIVIDTSNRAICDVYSLKAVKTSMYEKCYGYCALNCV